MELSGENDPLEQMINGDQASEQDVTVMESIAYDLLLAEEGTTQHYYTIGQEFGGPYAEISTYTDEEYPDDVPVVGIGLIDEDGNPLFRIEFDSKDEVSGIYYESADAFDHNISSALESIILDSDDNQERQLLDQIYGLVKIIEDGAIIELDDYKFEVDNFVEDYDSVADGFRYLVDSKYIASILIKDFDIALEENSSLSIVSHEAITGDIPESGPCKLYIEFKDRNLGMGYYFEHDQDDTCDVSATHLYEALDSDSSEPEEVDLAEIDIEEEKLAMSAMIRMYTGNLAKLHIDLLIAQLMEAELQNSLPAAE